MHIVHFPKKFLSLLKKVTNKQKSRNNKKKKNTSTVPEIEFAPEEPEAQAAFPGISSQLSASVIAASSVAWKNGGDTIDVTSVLEPNGPGAYGSSGAAFNGCRVGIHGFKAGIAQKNCGKWYKKRTSKKNYST